MKITEQQLFKFCDMAKDFARKYGLTVEIDTGLDTEKTNIHMSNGYRWKRYIVNWREVKSLADAGTSIFADALNEFRVKKANGVDSQFDISKVIFQNPATIVFWADGTKTVVKCQEGDLYSQEVGLALCFAKKALGNAGNFNNTFKKWLPDEPTKE